MFNVYLIQKEMEGDPWSFDPFADPMDYPGTDPLLFDPFTGSMDDRFTGPMDDPGTGPMDDPGTGPMDDPGTESGKRKRDDFGLIMTEIDEKKPKSGDLADLLLDNREIVEEVEETILFLPENMRKDKIYQQHGIENPEYMGRITSLIANVAGQLFEIELYDTDNEDGARILDGMIKERLRSIYSNREEEIRKAIPDFNHPSEWITNAKKMSRWLDENEQGYAPIAMSVFVEKVQHRLYRIQYDAYGAELKGKKFRDASSIAASEYKYMTRRNYKKFVDSWTKVERNRIEDISNRYLTEPDIRNRFEAEIQKLFLELRMPRWKDEPKFVPYVLKMLLDQRINIVEAIGAWVTKSYSTFFFVTQLHKFDIIEHYETWNQVVIEMLSLEEYVNARQILDTSDPPPDPLDPLGMGYSRLDIKGLVESWASKEGEGLWKLPWELIRDIIIQTNLMVYETGGTYMKTTEGAYKRFYRWMFRGFFEVFAYGKTESLKNYILKKITDLGIERFDNPRDFTQLDLLPLVTKRRRLEARMKRLGDAETNRKIIRNSISTALTIVQAMKDTTEDKSKIWKDLEKVMITSKVLLVENIEQLKLVNDRLFKNLKNARFYEELRTVIRALKLEERYPTIKWKTEIRNYYDFLVFGHQVYLFREFNISQDPEEELRIEFISMLDSLERLPDDFHYTKPEMLNGIILELINDIMYTEIRSSIDALEAIRGIEHEIKKMLHQSAPREYEEPERKYTAFGRRIRNFFLQNQILYF